MVFSIFKVAFLHKRFSDVIASGASVPLLRNKKVKAVFATDFADLHEFLKNQSAKIRAIRG